MTTYALIGLAVLVAVLGYLLYRAYKTIGAQKQRIATLEANVDVKDNQLKVLTNARPGDGAGALADGTF